MLWWSRIIVPVVFVMLVAWVVNVRVPLANSTRVIVNIVLALVVVGMGLWAINVYVPMAGSIKAILNVVVVVAVSVRVLQALGLWAPAVRLWHDWTRSHWPGDTAH